jgi:hypothetical protein
MKIARILKFIMKYKPPLGREILGCLRKRWEDQL